MHTVDSCVTICNMFSIFVVSAVSLFYSDAAAGFPRACVSL